jgi:Abnormal spindle-like microcephaly-assoc'd, ASPM-SPD-2-Hydin/Repeat of unknown function (DUF5648)
MLYRGWNLTKFLGRFERMSLRLICVVACVGALPAVAQDANNGKLLYNTPLVAGEKSCSASTCHTPDPLLRINKIQNGDTAGGIAVAINSVVQMGFLRGQVPGSQLADLAAYIADPASANAPVASLSTTSLSFGATIVGQTSAVQTVTVTNAGGSALSIASIVSSTSDFSITANTCASVAAGANCTFGVVFAPQASGQRSAQLTLIHNASGGSSVIALGGLGVRLSLTASAAQLAFSNRFVGDASQFELLQYVNTGNGAIAIQDIAVTNVSTFLLSRTTSCAAGVVLQPGEFCNVQLSFAPRTAGVSQDRLVIAHSGGTTNVELSGEGVAAPAGTRLMVEYIYRPLNYFFITSRAGDQEGLDFINGFERTEQVFFVYTTQVENTQGIARFYFDKIALNGNRGSHFYTMIEGERLGLQALNPTNVLLPRVPYFEGIDSFARPVVASVFGASCPVGHQPVYRMFRGNARFPDDPNHRFTPSAEIQRTLVAQGWDDEGIAFCAPTPSP